MPASLVLPSQTTIVTRPVTLSRNRTNEQYWPQALSAILLVILKILVFASIVLWPWESIE